MKDNQHKINQFLKLLQTYKPNTLKESEDLVVKSYFPMIRDLFYQYDKSEWSLKDSYNFIINNDVDPKLFIDFMEELFKVQFPYKLIKNGWKTAFDFIDRLKTSPKFKNSTPSKIKVSFDGNYIDFLNDIRALKENYMPSQSHNKWIHFVSDHFDTGRSKGTLRKDYYEKKI